LSFYYIALSVRISLEGAFKAPGVWDIIPRGGRYVCVIAKYLIHALLSCFYTPAALDKVYI